MNAHDNGTVPWWRRERFLAFVIVIATFAAYWPAWRGAPVFDDTDHLTPPELRSLGGLARIWTRVGAVSQYYPVTHTAFWLEQKLWGDDMLGYHLVNILLHALAAVLLARILKRLGIPGAWLAAAIFALHPVHVESVAWISELKNTLSGVFCLGATLAYLRFDATRLGKFYAAALTLFIAGLLSKAVIATLPAALLVIFWWKRGRISRQRDVVPLLPFFALGISAGLFTAWVERKFIGAEGEAFALSLADRFLIAGRAVWFYLGKLLWPGNLVFIYPRWQVSAAVWWQYLLPIALILLTAFLLSRSQSRNRGWLAALLLFSGTLFPVLGFLNVYPFIYSFVADHYQYLASTAVIALMSAGVAGWLANRGWWGQRVGNFLCLALLAMLATLTWRQSRMYTDTTTLWQTTLARNPACFVAHSNLANQLLLEGKIDEAIGHSRAALELQPRLAEVHNNLGDALLRKGQAGEAEEHFRKAIELRPSLAMAQFNLGVVLLQRGQLDEAQQRFEKAVGLRPEFVDARNQLGSILLEKGQVDEAAVHFAKALAVRPDDVDSLTNLGNALLREGKIDEAVVRYEKALAIAPDSELAHYNLGCALLQKQQTDAAIARFQKALALRPEFFQAHYFLANALLQKGQPAPAVAHYRAALKLQPEHPGILSDLAWVLATSPEKSIRNGAEATELARRANELSGNQNPFFLQGLAAAYAESSRFAEAAVTARRALQIATANGDTLMAGHLNGQLALYQEGKPVRDPVPLGPAENSSVP